MKERMQSEVTLFPQGELSSGCLGAEMKILQVCLSKGNFSISPPSYSSPFHSMENPQKTPAPAVIRLQQQEKSRTGKTHPAQPSHFTELENNYFKGLNLGSFVKQQQIKTGIVTDVSHPLQHTTSATFLNVLSQEGCIRQKTCLILGMTSKEPEDQQSLLGHMSAHQAIFTMFTQVHR